MNEFLKNQFVKRGFTLPEVVIASFIFTVIGVIGITIFVNVTRVQVRIALENAIYEDGRFMMERIARVVRQNTIDYEEYYNVVAEGKSYGELHGCYASRFYNYGSDGDFGATCNDGVTLVKDDPDCVVDKTTLDINTGQNPYKGIGVPTNYKPEDANSVCDEAYNLPAGCIVPANPAALHLRDELYLINNKGTTKTMFALKKVNSSPAEFVLAMLELEGADDDSDGITETWVDTAGGAPTYYRDYCASGYDCDTPTADYTNQPTRLHDGYTTAAKLYKGFVPVSPQRTTITDLKFYISPLDDPRKAFAETDISLAIQQQPHVTVVMSLQPADSQLAAFAGTPPTITLQNTITSRVYNDVRSYMSEARCTGAYK